MRAVDRYKGQLRDVLSTERRVRKRKRKEANPLSKKKKKAHGIHTEVMDCEKPEHAADGDISARRLRQRMRERRRKRTRVRHHKPSLELKLANAKMMQQANSASDDSTEENTGSSEEETDVSGDEIDADGDDGTSRMDSADLPKQANAAALAPALAPTSNPVRKLRKQLRWIAAIEEQEQRGEALTPVQLRRIGMKAELLDALKLLGGTLELTEVERLAAEAKATAAEVRRTADAKAATKKAREEQVARAESSAEAGASTPAMPTPSVEAAAPEELPKTMAMTETLAPAVEWFGSHGQPLGELKIWFDSVAALIVTNKGLKLHEVRTDETPCKRLSTCATV
eukprot:SAG11_NODE_124_length_15798_cov_14.675776_9_plen_341_part_00